MTEFRTRLMRAALGGWLAALAAPALFCQTVDFGEGGKPETAELKGHGLVVVARAPFLSSPIEGAAQLPDAPGFLTPVEYYRLNANNYWLVNVDGTDRWGWMPAGDVLGWMQVNGRTQGFDCLRVSKTNPVFQKVTLRNDWKAGDGAAAGRKLPETVDFLDAPDPSGQTIRPTRISEIFYVFARREVEGKAYVLLGADPSWTRERPEASIKGWVGEDQCTRWDSRLAVYFNQTNRANREHVIIFRNEADAQQYAKEGKLAGPTLAQEPNGPRKLTPADNRFPIIAQDGALLKVAFNASGNQAARLEKDKEVIRDIRNIQILFVIDATTSMQPYFDAVQRAIRESKSAMSAGVQAQYHFAAAIYRDYADEGQAATVIADFDDEKSLNKLGSVIAQSNPHDHDYPEAVYAGIINAVRSVSWNPRFLKAVVVIGDHGNHPTEAEASRWELKDALEDRDGSTAQAVADVLDPTDPEKAKASKTGPILFNAINVNVRQNWIHYNDLFVDQMNQILDATAHGGPVDEQHRHGMGLVGRLGIDDASDAARAKDQVKKAIAAAFADTNRAAQGLTQAIDTGSCGMPTAPAGEDPFFGPQACAFLMDSVKKVGWAAPEKGFTLISEEGWLLSEKGGQQLVEPWVWMSRSEVFSFSGFLSGLLTAAGGPERAADVIAQTVSAATGDVLEKEESLAAYVQRAFQLPFRDDTILRYTPEQLQKKLLNDRSFQEEFRKEIGRSLERLSLANAEQNADIPLTWEPNLSRWVKPPVGKIPTEPRWAASLGLEQYGWFPLSYLPGGLQ